MNDYIRIDKKFKYVYSIEYLNLSWFIYKHKVVIALAKWGNWNDEILDLLNYIETLNFKTTYGKSFKTITYGFKKEVIEMRKFMRLPTDTSKDRYNEVVKRYNFFKNLHTIFNYLFILVIAGMIMYLFYFYTLMQ